MGTLSDIIDQVKAWVRNVVSAATVTLRSWVDGLISGVKTLINNAKKTLWDALGPLRSAWSNFRTYTLPKIWTAIQNAGTWITQTISNVYNTVVQNITNVVNNVTSYITNVTNVTKRYITNVTGTTTTWVMGYIAKIIPADFIRDPWGYLQAAFNKFLDVWILGAVRSLAEGLQIGLAGNPPEPEGPGASFKLGFNSVVDEEEGHVGHG